MRYFVGITDRHWFDFLSRLNGLDEVNFWQPSAPQQFRALQIGEPFLFKLHSSDDYIVGGGFFSHFTIWPASIVWQAFGEKNGARTEDEMRARVARYRRASNSGAADDYQIGCILLESPFFLDRADWIPCQTATHIRSYSFGGTHAPSNGILLRQDPHTLFDQGYITVTPSHRIEISSQIKAEFHNGKEYYKLHGETMRLPKLSDRQPSAKFLRWHNDNVYRS